MAFPQKTDDFSHVDHLIIVCCHAIWLGGPSNGQDESEWAIESFQLGETPTFIEHIKAGLHILSEQPNSLLVFSGGPTKPKITHLSEAETYLTLALTPHLTQTPFPRSHLTTDTNATDSHQNLLFSLLCFHTLTARYPAHITLISHAFKRDRFVHIHRAAIRWPEQRFSFVGIDPPESVTPRSALQGGVVRAMREWEGDRYGVGEGLGGKRRRRGWGVGNEAVLGGCERGVRELVEWRGGETGREIYPGGLPWA